MVTDDLLRPGAAPGPLSAPWHEQRTCGPSASIARKGRLVMFSTSPSLVRLGTVLRPVAGGRPRHRTASGSHSFVPKGDAR